MTGTFGRWIIRFAVAMLMAPAPGSSPSERVLSVCELSRDFASFDQKSVTVRGVYYYGLRQECGGKCATGVWPSFIDLVSATDEVWAGLKKTERAVVEDAKRRGGRFEIWVTAAGRLEATPKRSPLGPCDRAAWGAYGHLGAFPARLVVREFRDIQVKENPRSPYDYAHVYRGPA